MENNSAQDIKKEYERNMFSGLEISYPDPNKPDIEICGTIGCRIQVDEKDYILTCDHIFDPMKKNDYKDTNVYQPSIVNNKIACGTYVAGEYLYDPSRGFNYDCALVKISGRILEDKIPTDNTVTKFNNLQGMRYAKKNEEVYKYGAVTGYTEGKIISITYSREGKYGELGICNGIMIESTEKGKAFSNPGDSGSVIVAKSDNKIVGLLHGSLLDKNDIAGESSSHAIALHIEEQVQYLTDLLKKSK